jgi:23S rRNA pseudouridine1911/1915/1917 synthase
MYTFEKNILYWDNHIVIANKPAGMLSQKDRTGDDSILESLKQFIKERFDKPGEVFLGSVHRLDRPAFGLMIFAKTSKALTRLNKMIQKGEIHKEYYAVVEGIPEFSEKTLVHYLYKDTHHNLVKCYSSEGKGRKKAILHYKMLAHTKKLSLLDIHLQTGRPHQIRVQLADMACPIVGDLKYGATGPNADKSICLMSKRLQFIHPVSKEYLDFRLDLPRDKAVWSLF